MDAKCYRILCEFNNPSEQFKKVIKKVAMQRFVGNCVKTVFFVNIILTMQTVYYAKFANYVTTVVNKMDRSCYVTYFLY